VQTADPAIRIFDFLAQFPERNTSTTICAQDLSKGLTQVGSLLKRTIADTCFEMTLADVDAQTAGPQYDCAVTEVRSTPGQPDEELGVIRACNANRSNVPCWHVEEDMQHCSYTATHLSLVIERGNAIPSPDIHAVASCVTR
jgi:hypothetical protein